MDGELWGARLSASRRHHLLHTSSQSHPDRPLGLDDLEDKNDAHRDLTCPFCYEEFDIASLCSHLDEEHYMESKSAVCPVCAAKVGKDMVGHITLQHSHLFKISYLQHMQHSRRFRKTGTSSNSTLLILGKELREVHLQAILGGNSSQSVASTFKTGADPVLSALVYNLPSTEADDVFKPRVTNVESLANSSSLSAHQPRPSLRASLTAEEWGQKLEEQALRANFVQQLVLSLILTDPGFVRY